MSVRFSWTVQEADGDAVVGANVDLYYSGGAKYADMTDNGDGSYYCSVAASGKYDVYIGGVKQDEGTGIWIQADDYPTVATISAKADKVTGATNNNFASLDANGNLKDSTYDATDFLTSSHVNANGAGGTSTPATNKVHNAAAIAVTDAGGLLTATDVEAALAEIKTLIGTGSFTTGDFIKEFSNITDALLGLNNQLWDLYIRGGDNSSSLGTTYRQHYIFTVSGATGASGYLDINNIATAAGGILSPAPGYITAVTATWESSSMTSTNIDIGYAYIGGLVSTILSIAQADAAAKKKGTSFSSPALAVSTDTPWGLYYSRTTGSGTLTDVVVLVEVTYGLTTT